MKLFVLIMCLLPSQLLAASYTEVFEQFKKTNSEFSSYELIEKSQSTDSTGEFVAAKGDVDHDGYEDVIFGIQDATSGKKQSKRVVVMSGRANGLFRTILVNQPIAEEGDYFTVQVINVCCKRTVQRRFLIGVHSGGFTAQKRPENSRYIELTLKQKVLFIDYLLYMSPWRAELELPNHAYLYDFQNRTYEEEWEVLQYNKNTDVKERVGRRERGTFKLQDEHSTLYLKDGTDPFKAVVVGEKNITPQMISEHTIKTPE